MNLDPFLSGAVSPVNYSDPDPEFGNEKCIFLSIYIDSDPKFGHEKMHFFFFFFFFFFFSEILNSPVRIQ